MNALNALFFVVFSLVTFYTCYFAIKAKRWYDDVQEIKRLNNMDAQALVAAAHQHVRG